MIKKIVLILIVFPMFAFGQVTVEIPTEYVNSHSIVTSSKLSNYQGSPYLDKNFKVGKIILENNKIINSKMRYNAYSDNFEFFENGKIKALLKIKNSQVILDNKIFVLKNIPNDNSSNGSYVQQLVGKGKIKLFKRYFKKFMEAKKATSSYGADKLAKFELKTNYFTENISTNKMKALKLNKKNIFLLMNDNISEIKKYLKKEKLKLSKEKDLVKLFDYYNSL